MSASVCSLFRAEQKHLRLGAFLRTPRQAECGLTHINPFAAALRYLRACLALNDDFYNRHLIKSELFGPIVSLATSELDHENLLGSACLEFFEHVRQVSCLILFISLRTKCLIEFVFAV